jgi:hypothetical protein
MTKTFWSSFALKDWYIVSVGEMARSRMVIMRRVVYVVEYQMRKRGMRMAAVGVRRKESMHRCENIRN